MAVLMPLRSLELASSELDSGESVWKELVRLGREIGEGCKQKVLAVSAVLRGLDQLALVEGAGTGIRSCGRSSGFQRKLSSRVRR